MEEFIESPSPVEHLWTWGQPVTEDDLAEALNVVVNSAGDIIHIEYDIGRYTLRETVEIVSIGRDTGFRKRHVKPLIKRIRLEMRLAPKLHHVYLLASRIDRSASFWTVTNDQQNKSQGLISAFMRGPFMATFYHWSLCITDDDGRPEGSRLYELQVSDGRIRLTINYNPKSAWDASQIIRLLGYTMCSDSLIKQHGKHQNTSTYHHYLSGNLMRSHPADEVVHSMPVNYNVMNNNCQTFCSRLLERIRHVADSAELNTGRKDLHLDAFQQILGRRAMELVCWSLMTELDSSTAATLVVDVAPLSLHAASLNLLDVLTVILLYQSYRQLSRRFCFLLVLVLSLHSLNGNAGLFRHLQSTRRLGERPDEGDDFVSGLVARPFARKNSGYTEESCNENGDGALEIPGAWFE
jgi:hypothetical protein